MKHPPSCEDEPTMHTREPAKARSHRAFAKRLSAGLISLVAFAVLAGGLLYGQGSGTHYSLTKRAMSGFAPVNPRQNWMSTGLLRLKGWM